MIKQIPGPNWKYRITGRFNNNVLTTLYLEIQPLKWVTYKITPSVEWERKDQELAAQLIILAVEAITGFFV